jgi:hypothetical protein
MVNHHMRKMGLYLVIKIKEVSMKINFCFKTDKALKMAQDNVTGEPCEAYLKVTLDGEKPPSKTTHKEAHEEVKKRVAEEMHVDIKLLYPISEEEYLNNVEDEDC